MQYSMCLNHWRRKTYEPSSLIYFTLFTNWMIDAMECPIMCFFVCIMHLTTKIYEKIGLCWSGKNALLKKEEKEKVMSYDHLISRFNCQFFLLLRLHLKLIVQISSTSYYLKLKINFWKAKDWTQFLELSKTLNFPFITTS